MNCKYCEKELLTKPSWRWNKQVFCNHSCAALYNKEKNDSNLSKSSSRIKSELNPSIDAYVEIKPEQNVRKEYIQEMEKQGMGLCFVTEKFLSKYC
jgi:hypothetical protein